MFKKILIANRGEIALRIIRACNDLGIQTVLIHSEADADALSVSLADESYCIGPASLGQSYLNIPAIINVAILAEVDAIHPGYGFLSENAHFAEICEEHKIKFIGPSADVIRRMGDKSVARDTVKQIKVPTVPGSDGLITDNSDWSALAAKLGYPILVKATAGGGGRGMRIANTMAELEHAILSASQEAQAAFGNAGVYLEKYISRMRHIEIQVFGDSHGNYIHLGERDCSVQRRHQKILEEAPSPAISSALRKKMGHAAVEIARSISYEGAGTIEFILDLSTNEFYFMEMNTRIQVEHPVTEQVTRTDLVVEQIRVASGLPLSITQSQIDSLYSSGAAGHAMEFRINAEDPFDGFRPSPGLLKNFIVPGGVGVRVDTHCYAGYTIPPYYDSLIGKLIIYGKDRTEVISRSRRALVEFGIDGIKTTIPLFLDILEDEQFISGDITTAYLEGLLNK